MDKLTISLDRLGNERKVFLKETLVPSFLQVNEEELQFREPVHIAIEAYLAEDHLIANLSVETTALLPCNICNAVVPLSIKIKNLCLTLPLSEISSHVYDFSEDIRENLLLQTPLFAECAEGNCPERAHLKKFLTKEPIPIQQPQKGSDIHFPFSNLSKDLS